VVGCGILAEVKFIHSRGVIHRDLNPANVLIDEHGSATVGGLGLTMTAQVGTPLHMAPETYEECKHTVAVDVDSFALILYEIVVGEAPFPAAMTWNVLCRKTIAGERPQLPNEFQSTVRDIIDHGFTAASKERQDILPSAFALTVYIQFSLIISFWGLIFVP
jgi:serine/threonine protein kinase